jgi:hypothetical protein
MNNEAKMIEEKKDNFYYLMRDILSCFPNKFENNFLGIINQHYIAKETTRKILMEEIEMENPSFKILSGGLILQNVYLRQIPEVALYEAINILPVLNYCYRIDKRTTIKRHSSDIILRLFTGLYYEFIFLPLNTIKEEIDYINRFKKVFSKEDVWNIYEV